jgi:hypothetical protein
LALLVGEYRQQVVHATGEVPRHDPIVDLVGPRHRRLRPRAIGVESFDRFSVGSAGALLAARARASAVEQYVEQPCLERRPTFEPLDPTHDCEPRVLAHFLGDSTAADGRLRKAKQVRLITPDKFDERGLIAGAQPFDESAVVVHVDRGYDVVNKGEGHSIVNRRSGHLR